MSSALVKRDVFHEVGGFNNKYSYVEEWDLWLHIARNYDVALVPQVLTKIRLHGSNQSRNAQRRKRSWLWSEGFTLQTRQGSGHADWHSRNSRSALPSLN